MKEVKLIILERLREQIKSVSLTSDSSMLEQILLTIVDELDKMQQCYLSGL